MKHIWWLLIFLLPAFAVMFRPGIYTMHDFHIFRQFEFDKCARELSLPCRWAPDSTLGYGQPLFNFYGQLPYWIGEVFVLLGLQTITSVKIVFALTLILSALTMYVLASDLWGKCGGLISAAFYVFAPYRAVDVWVRGALNECLAFVFFPLILWSVKKYIQSSHNKYVIWLALSIAGLLITHNLSFLMFAPFAGIWTIFWLVKTKSYKAVVGLVEGGLMAILLSAFYLLPVIAETYLVTVGKTTQDYYNFRIHFTTLQQLFISNFWGYGGSTWGPNDTMSFAVGYLHSLAVIACGVLVVVSKKVRNFAPLIMLVGLFTALAWFLAHGKSEFIWNNFPGLSYVQFPWRFLSLGVLFSSLLIGSATLAIQNKFLLSCALTLLLLLNAGLFKPDIWRSITDREQFTGDLWREQISSAISDFWPVASEALPDKPSSGEPIILMGEARIKPAYKGAHKFTYNVDVYSEYAKIRFPIVYFPGWIGHGVEIFPEGEYGLITARLGQGSHKLELEFTNTWIRNVANLTSILSAVFVVMWGIKYVKK